MSTWDDLAWALSEVGNDLEELQREMAELLAKREQILAEMSPVKVGDVVMWHGGGETARDLKVTDVLYRPEKPSRPQVRGHLLLPSGKWSKRLTCAYDCWYTMDEWKERLDTQTPPV